MVRQQKASKGGLTEQERSVRDEKVKAFNKLITDKLHVDLRAILDVRDSLYQRIAEYVQLERNVEMLQQNFASPKQASSSAGSALIEELEENVEGGGMKKRGYVLPAAPTPMKSLVNVGSDFFMHAVTPDTRLVTVDVGLGFWMEMNHSEAIAFCGAKRGLMQKNADMLTEKAALVSSHIKLVYKGIAELMQLDNPAYGTGSASD